jgi:hypothetical protein
MRSSPVNPSSYSSQRVAVPPLLQGASGVRQDARDRVRLFSPYGHEAPPSQHEDASQQLPEAAQGLGVYLGYWLKPSVGQVLAGLIGRCSYGCWCQV